MGVDVALTLVKSRFPIVGKVLEGAPLVIVDDGKPLKKRMDRCKVDEEDILEAARTTHGLQRMDQIKYAVLEKDGTISVIPNKRV